MLRLFVTAHEISSSLTVSQDDTAHYQCRLCCAVMNTLLISDLHLDPARPEITALFEHFLVTEARQAEALYILGDLFDVWLGDDNDDPLPARVAVSLAQLAMTGVPVYFMVGNRDFLLGEAYANRAGIQLLDDGCVHTIGGVATVLLHGDVLCTDDTAYQKFRVEVRDPTWQAKFLAQPLAARRAYAQRARIASQVHTRDSAEILMDVNAQAVDATLRQSAVRRMIHGHTHRPAVHDLALNGQPVQRIVLGDWYAQGSVLQVAAQGDFALRTLSP